MVASLGGIIFYEFYGDNTGGTELDVDGDGTATQEDEFVSVQNTSGAAIDISGWQIWSDSAGAGAPDRPQDGLYHTFPPGTELASGETLRIVNEITGTPKAGMQEASEGGVESGSGGTSTNFLSEGGNSRHAESVGLVDPSTGDYIILNLNGSKASGVPGQSGFPGSSLVAESNAATDSGVEDQNAGSSFRYNSATDSYEYGALVICFVAGTLIAVPGGERRIETLVPGDLVETYDHGAQKVRSILKKRLDFAAWADSRHKPIEFKPGSLGFNRPSRRLLVSPQHRMLVQTSDHDQVLVPAKSLIDRIGVRRMNGRKTVEYVHLVFDRHEIVSAEGCWSESFFPGAYALSQADRRTRAELFAIYSGLATSGPPQNARRLIKATQARDMAPLVAAQ